MRSGMMVWVSLAGVGIFAQHGELQTQSSPQSPPVREIALDTLRDVAVAVYDPKGSIIYYNPAYLQRLGPQLSAFFMAHEYGHLALRHTRGNALAGKRRKSFNARLQEQELAADCYAAAKLGRDNPSAVEATLHFFTRMGPFSYDAAHPSGSQRAAKILSCLPRADETAPTDSIGNADADSPGSSAGGGITVTVPLHSDRVPWQAIHFRIGNIQSAVSNLQPLRAVALPSLAAGTYDYELRVNVFYLDDQFQLNPSGTIVGSGSITVRGGETLRVEFSRGGGAVLMAGE